MIVKIWDFPNWGDQLNKLLFKILTNEDITYSHAYENIQQQHYIGIGSILEYAEEQSIIWGTGFITKSTIPTKPLKIHAVRGKKTRDVFIKNNIDCPEVYGDPSIVFSLFYKPKINKTHKIGIIKHHFDKNNYEGYIINEDPSLNSPYCYIDAICNCEKIMSSSLHGLIIADIYGIPSEQIKIGLDQFKFEDYYSAKEEADPIKLLKNCPLKKNIKNDGNLLLKINLGSNDIRIPGFLNIDIVKYKNVDIIANCKDLPFQDNIASEILASHIIEHFDFHEGLEALKEWHRILSPGGKLTIECPDLDYFCRNFILLPEHEKPNYYCQLFGFPWEKGQGHKFGYTPSQLKWSLKECGFKYFKKIPATRYNNINEWNQKYEAIK